MEANLAWEKLHVLGSERSNQAAGKRTRKNFSTKVFSRPVVIRAAVCGLLQKVSILRGCQDKVSRTTMATLGHQMI